MDKLFKVGGVSKGKNGYKVRFANDMTRVKILAKTEEDINLIELPKEMTKPELVTFLKTTELYSNPAYREAIDTADAKYNGQVAVKATKVKATKAAVKGEKKPAKAKAEKPAKAKAPAKGKTVKAKAEKPTLASIKAKAEKAKAAEAEASTTAEAAPAAEVAAEPAAE